MKSVRILYYDVVIMHTTVTHMSTVGKYTATHKSTAGKLGHFCTPSGFTSDVYIKYPCKRPDELVVIISDVYGVQFW